MTSTNPATLVKNAIHNPTEPRHFMRIVPASGRRTVTAAGHTIADSVNAVVVKEVGLDIYDPIVYFPRKDVNMDVLTVVDRTTHCPLKGDTEYFDFQAGEDHVAEIAWSYVRMVDGDELFELIAFDPSSVIHRTATDET
jgi:uncharacterized protein (DUF427 family)